MTALELTLEQRIQKVRQITFQLERADYGLGMPRDYELVCTLRTHLETAIGEALTAIHDAFVNGPLKMHDAVALVESLGEDEAERVVDEWADLAELVQDETK